MTVHRICRNLAAIAASLGILATSSAVRPAGAADSYSEDAVKAAYLYRFAGYVDWPNDMPADAPFIIDVLGAPGIARELQRLLPKHTINNRVAQVREISSVRDLGAAQIVYAAAGRSELLRTLNPAAGRPAMLLVTDEEDGLTAGSTLNFVTIDRSVRFEVSLMAANRWGLKISSELLGVAIRVLGSGHQSSLDCLRFELADAVDGRCLRRMALRRGPSRAARPGDRG